MEAAASNRPPRNFPHLAASASRGQARPRLFLKPALSHSLLTEAGKYHLSAEVDCGCGLKYYLTKCPAWRLRLLLRTRCHCQMEFLRLGSWLHKPQRLACILRSLMEHGRSVVP